MKLRPLSLLLGWMAISPICYVSPSYAAAISFDEAWQVLQQENNSLAAQRANVNRYLYLQAGTDDLKLQKVTIGANYTLLDSDVTVCG